MPEGHTIHRLARDQRRDFVGQRLQVSSPQGRFAAGAKLLDGRILEGIDAYGKHLCYHWQGKRRLHIHLGLYGKYFRHRCPPPAPRGQVRLRAVGEKYCFDLNGPNQCELLSARDWEKLLDRLGPDPLRDDADADQAWRRIHKSQAAIGGLLLDQSVIAGVGNIYRSEVLYLEGIHPQRQGNSLSREEFDRVWARLVKLLQVGVRYNRIITADAKAIGKPPSRLNRQERLLIYKKDWCERCDTMIASWKLAARTVFACPQCQPLED